VIIVFKYFFVQKSRFINHKIVLIGLFFLSRKEKLIFCIFRPTLCDYSLLGCNWNGPFHTLSSHRDICEYPAKNGLELIDTIRAQKRAYDEEKKCLETVVDLLSLNQIGVSGK
jgi:hypothetical protein